jgi:phage terminase small subunit
MSKKKPAKQAKAGPKRTPAGTFVKGTSDDPRGRRPKGLATVEKLQRALTPKQLRFCEEYPIDFNATKAAERAGYSRKTAYSIGQRLLKKVEIQAEIQERVQRLTDKAGVTAERIIAELAKIGFMDPRRLFTERGNLRSITELPDDIAACLSSVEVVSRNKGRNAEGETEIEHVHKIRLWDKKGALELLGKNLAMWTDRLAVDDLRTMTDEELEAETERLARQAGWRKADE